jgi:uncharacterized protein YqfA (UPF0365 family)
MKNTKKELAQAINAAWAAEIARLRAEVERWQVLADRCEIRFKIEKARAKIAEADTARLDWLGKASYAKFYEGPCVWRINGDEKTEGDTLRDAIDAAMTKEASK